MTINERINAIISDLYNGNKRAFANAIGVAPTVIENVVGSRQSKPSYGVLEKICAIANISAAWIINGEGRMLKTDSEEKPMLSGKIPTQIETRPRIPFDAVAGQLSIALDSATEADCEQIPVIPTFPRYDFTIFARGDSMEPEFVSGDELACLFIKDSSFIQWGRAHVLDTAQGIVVKRIFDNGNSIICKSNNPNYPDFSITKADIYRMALVVGFIRIS